MVVLRDGRKLIGILRSFDQFGMLFARIVFFTVPLVQYTHFSVQQTWFYKIPLREYMLVTAMATYPVAYF